MCFKLIFDPQSTQIYQSPKFFSNIISNTHVWSSNFFFTFKDLISVLGPSPLGSLVVGYYILV